MPTKVFENDMTCLFIPQKKAKANVQITYVYFRAEQVMWVPVRLIKNSNSGDVDPLPAVKVTRATERPSGVL